MNDSTHVAADALALCERAEAHMTALEHALIGYRVAVAALVLRLRDRQRQDLLHLDGAEAELQLARDQRAIDRAHRHDAATVAMLKGVRGGGFRMRDPQRVTAGGRLQ